MASPLDRPFASTVAKDQPGKIDFNDATTSSLTPIVSCKKITSRGITTTNLFKDDFFVELAKPVHFNERIFIEEPPLGVSFL